MASDFGVCGRRLGIFGMSSACYPHSMYQRTVLIKKGASVLRANEHEIDGNGVIPPI